MTDKPVAPSKRIYIDLIGDLFHVGHLRHLEKAASIGDTLVVGVFDDTTSASLSHTPVIPLADRVAVIAALRCVDEVIPAAPDAPDLAFLEKMNIDTVCLSDDFNDPKRQRALTELLDDGIGIVLPYTEEERTTAIIGRITGEEVENQTTIGADSALVHPVATTSGNDTVLDAIGALSAAYFGRQWLLNRDRLGTATWMALLKCMAGNAVERQTHRQTDPRFVPALVSLIDRFSARDGDRINLIGAAAPLVGSVLANKNRRVTDLKPGASALSSDTSPSSAGLETVRCGLFDLPDACPPADILAVLDRAWSGLLIIDGELLAATTLRLKRDLLLCVDLWPEDSGSFSPVNNLGTFAFSDTYVRKALHSRGFFDVEDVVTTVNGAPKHSDTPGCGRVSRNDMVESTDPTDGFIFLDGGPPQACGSPADGQFIRWYRASKQPIRSDPA